MTTREDRLAGEQAIQAGSKQHLGKTTLIVDGKKWSSSDIVALCKKRIEVQNQVIQKHAAWMEAVAAEKAMIDATQADADGIVQVIKVMFASSQQTLADFGLSPKKARRAPTKKQTNTAPAETGAGATPSAPAAPAAKGA